MYEETSLVQLSTLDSCYARLYFYSGPAAVTAVPRLSDASTVSTLARSGEAARPSIVFDAAIDHAGALVLERTDLATGQTAGRTLGGAVVREQMLALCSPPPVPSQSEDQLGAQEQSAGGDASFSGCC